MLSGERGDMRVMVLHRDHRRPQPGGELRGGKIGMKIAGDRDRLDLEDRQHVPQGFFEERDRRRRVEVADVLRDEGFAAARDRDRCLQLGTQGNDSGNLASELESLPV